MIIHRRFECRSMTSARHSIARKCERQRISHHKRHTFMLWMYSQHFELCPVTQYTTKWKDTNKPNDSIMGSKSHSTLFSIECPGNFRSPSCFHSATRSFFLHTILDWRCYACARKQRERNGGQGGAALTDASKKSKLQTAICLNFAVSSDFIRWCHASSTWRML